MAKVDKTITTVHSDADSDGFAIKRMKVRGGWYVYTVKSGTPGNAVKIDDPDHQWEPSTTDDA